MNYGGPSTEAEFGRINLDLSRDIEEQTMMCPMMVWGAKAQRRPTMSIRQCVDRIGLRNPCTRHCSEIVAVLERWGTTRKEVEEMWGRSTPDWVSWVDKLRESERHG